MKGIIQQYRPEVVIESNVPRKARAKRILSQVNIVGDVPLNIAVYLAPSNVRVHYVEVVA